MIFQDPQSSLNERAKVSYIVGEGLQNVRPDLSAAQREEKVRQALLDTGLNMAVSKGLKGLHLAELAAAVGISKPYFYTFF
mgnify:FL=1